VETLLAVVVHQVKEIVVVKVLQDQVVVVVEVGVVLVRLVKKV
jgi:hypothetical protein